MAKGGIIKFDDVEVEVFLSTTTMMNIKEEMGRPFEELQMWLTGNDEDEKIDISTQLYRLSHVIGHLANGAIFKHNSAVKEGFKDGEIKKYYNLDSFTNIIDPFQMEYYFKAVFECISKGTVVSIPDNVKFAEEDEVLKEIEDEKNQMGGNVETIVESSGEA